MAGQDVQTILRRYETEPSQEPMHGQSGQVRRAPSTDQKKVRREMSRKADLEDTPVTHSIASLLGQASVTDSLTERQELMRQVEGLRTEAARKAADDRGYQVSEAKIRDVMVPGRTHELVTNDTDWVLGLTSTASLGAQTDAQGIIAEATLWFGRVSDDVKAYPEEFAEQARGMGRRTAGKFGDDAPAAERMFLDEVGRLHAQALHAGLISLQAEASFDPDLGANDWQFEPKEAASSLPQVADSAIPPDTFSTLNGGGTVPPEATNSNRAPAMQEIQNYTGWDGTSVVPQGDNGAAGQNAGGSTVGEQDAAASQGKSGFPVGASLQHTAHKESPMAHVACPTCGGHGKVAVRAHDPKVAYSGLPQIDQIMNPADDAPEPTPLPTDVAFPLTWSPNNVPSAINQAEQQISQRNSQSPLLKGSSQHQANGRDNSGWIGDDGAKGTDYPGYSTPSGYDGSSNLGEADPVYGTGGDNGNQPLKPYGAQEADDRTNNPGTWQPGQDTHDDQGYREVSPGLNTQGSQDPYILQAQATILAAQRQIAERNRINAGR